MAVGIHELVYNKLYEILADGAGAITNPLYVFQVEKSSFRMQTMKKDAAIFIRQEGMRPTNDGSGSMRHMQFDVSYIIDCIAMARGRKVGETYEQAQERADARLRHLIHQVMRILWEEQDLLLPVGTTGGIKPPNVTFFELEEIQTERPIVGARMEIKVPIPFQPEGIDGPELESIGININSPPEWSAEILPDEGEA